MTTKFVCTICDKPVSLQDNKTDEKGQPVHKDCYLE
jgi:hypothetical protein